MNTSTRNVTIAALLLVGLIAGVAWTWWDERVPTDRLLLAGDVRAEIYTVAAPTITYPTPDYAVGIPSSSAKSMTGASSSRSARPAGRSSLPVVSGRLESVAVRQGDAVAKGDVLAVLDTAMLDLGVQQAKTAAARAKTDVSLMESNLDTVADNQGKLADAKSKINKGAAQLTDARAKLVAARKKLVSTRAKALAGKKAIEAQIAALEQLIASGGSKPATPTPGPTPQQILATLKTKLAELNAGIKQMDAGIAKMDAGLKKMDAATKKLASAKSKLATGASALADAKTQLNTAKDVLGKVADARAVAVKSAEAQRDAGTLTAPVDGTVTFARPSGTVAMVGAPLVRIAPTRTQLVDTYLTGEQLARIEVGSKAEIGADSIEDQVLAGRVVTIGSAYVFPPTNFPTDIVHMTRAVKVTVAIDSATRIPPGTPVDLTIFTTSSR
ncbi:MAG TPA: biotin/lipoyl-binding protein [Coriobacteriia bacterium]|nr:biotin/lipoyl-binding protein [Coriobacteriia bacterium]